MFLNNIKKSVDILVQVLNRKHEMFLNNGNSYLYSASEYLNRKHEMFLNYIIKNCGVYCGVLLTVNMKCF